MKNKIDDLRNHLFETLERLKDEENPMDIDRAEAVAKVAGVIIDSARVEVGYLKITGARGSGFIPDTAPKPVIGPLATGTESGRIVHKIR